MENVMCFKFKLFASVDDKELVKLIDKNDPKAIHVRDAIWKKATDKPKEMSSFELYCRYGKG